MHKISKRKKEADTMKELRRKQIANYIAKQNSVTMTELVDTFQVSMNTIRSDISYLVRTGAVVKIYGGVQSAADIPVPYFTSRATLNMGKKKAIARKAAEQIYENDIIYVDSGTTTMYLLDYVDPKLPVTVITPNLYVITSLANKPKVKLVVLPGVLDRRTNSLKETNTFLELSKYQIHKAFMACSGVTPDGHISVSTYLESEIKKTAVQKSEKNFLLADSEKFLDSRLLSYGTISQMSCVYSDAGLHSEPLQMLKQYQVPYILV